jgi:hypothetical protein
MEDGIEVSFRANWSGEAAAQVASPRSQVPRLLKGKQHLQLANKTVGLPTNPKANQAR